MAPDRVAEPEIVTLHDERPLATWQEYREAGVPELLGSMQLCFVLQACAKTGLATRLRSGISAEEELTEGLDPYLGSHVLRYLAIKGVIERDGGGYRLTVRGRKLLSDISLAQIGFYVEAYGPVMESIPRLLTGDARYGRDVLRDGQALGRHSATMFDTFHVSAILTILKKVNANCVLDLGCGTGPLLLAACQLNQALRGVGIDIAPEPIAYAQNVAERDGLSKRLAFVVADAFVPDAWPDVCFTADTICAVGVLHEHFRDGEQAVIDILNLYAQLLRRGMKTLILGEPELRYDDRDDDSGFYLAHIFTAQGFPRDKESWLELFDRTDLKCRTVLSRPEAGQRLIFYELAAR